MAATKHWTVMVWMAGDNDLEENANLDLKELSKVGSSADVNVLAQVDRGSDGSTRRYRVMPGDAQEIKNLGPTNTGDPKTAIDFFSWGLTQYPAQRTLAVLWNHGSGIDEADVYRRARAAGFSVERRAAPTKTVVPRHRLRAIASRRPGLFSSTVDKTIRIRGLAYDDSARDFLDNVELTRVLAAVRKAAGRKIDVVGFDACLMNNLEMAHQLRASAGVIVGSEEVEPLDGWPYDRVLKRLVAQPDLTPRALAAQIVKEYAASYRDDAVTQSALDLARIGPVATAVDALARALLAALRTPAGYAAIAKAARAAQRFDLRDFVDLEDLTLQLDARLKGTAVRAAGKGVRKALRGEQGFVSAEAHKGSRVKNARGVSIYLPTAGDVSVAYARLDFASRTAWGRFVDAYQRT